MDWHATEAIEKSAKRTRELLLPPKIGLWIKLVIITVLAGKGVPQLFAYIPANIQRYYGTTPFINFLTTSEQLTVLFGSTILISGLLLYYIQNTMEFVFFKTIRDEKASITEFFNQNKFRGLRYTVYRILYAALIVFMSALVAVTMQINFFSGILVFLFVAPLVMLFLIADIAVRDFVVPEMLLNEKKFVEASKSVYSMLESDWRQFAVYVLVRTAVLMAVGIAVAMATGFTLFFFMVPMMMLLVLTGVTPLFLLPLMMLAIISVSVLFLVAMPFQAYVYSYRLSSYELFSRKED